MRTLLLHDPDRQDAGGLQAGGPGRTAAGREMPRRWCCAQIGARESYAVPRALRRRDELGRLVTDIWSDHIGVARLFSRNLNERTHAELAGGPVYSVSRAALSREVGDRLRGAGGWARIIARNRWFERTAVQCLEQLGLRDGEVTVFAYSYAARKILAYARRRGWRTVLGQIDPGPFEESIVSEEHSRRAGLASDWQPAPASYWQDWRDEIELADHVVVNSEWSRRGLAKAGVPSDKLTVVPLAHEPPAEAAGFRRRYPERFDRRRPLRVLFLGQVNLRKGVGALLEAARLLGDAPVEFRLVGPMQVSPPAGRAARGARLIFEGPAARSAVNGHYRDADVLVFPTLSDGFGITQLEARAWRLPLIVTRRCGAVVEDGVTGLFVEAGDAEGIAAAIRRCIASPEWLQSAADAVAPGERHGIDDLGRALAALA